ncbi:MAG TPA: hypothetical protein VNM90_29885 [Haliangium sp.]|nr:hypothetical protein [Haliangium sp.]
MAHQALAQTHRGHQVKAVIGGSQEEYGADLRAHVPGNPLDGLRQDIGQGVQPIDEEGNVALYRHASSHRSPWPWTTL